MKKESIFTCQKCTYQSSKWQGRCPECGNWNSLIEGSVQPFSKRNTQDKPKTRKALKLSEITSIENQQEKTGLIEFDRVLGGGLEIGSVVLLSGEPGVGKSTLLLEILKNISQNKTIEGKNLLYISGEESEGQIFKRANRLGLKGNNISIFCETNLENIKEEIEKLKPSFIILDSIQTTTSENCSGVAGSISQVRFVCNTVIEISKSKNITTIIVGQVTKDGALAGPKLLEHMVDVVLSLETKEDSDIKILRSSKNRFGTTREVGFLEMGAHGIQSKINSELVMKKDSNERYVGRSLGCMHEGSRLVYVETQALVVDNKTGLGKRVAYGIDQTRVTILLAIIEKYLDLKLEYKDIFLNIISPTKNISKEIDLSIVASIISAVKNKPIKQTELFYGEVGLSGEIRSKESIKEHFFELEQMKVSRFVTGNSVFKKNSNEYQMEVVGYVSVSENIL